MENEQKELKNRAKATEESGASIGQRLIEGIAEGAEEKEADLQSGLRKILSRMLDSVKKNLGIHSPSRVFSDEVGKQIVAGVAEGLDENGELAKRALESLNGEMLAAEKKYLQEKERLDKENAVLEEERQQREYQKRLASAKDAVNAENIKQNEILRRKKAADEAYLAELKISAEAEKALLEQLQKEIRDIYGDIAEEAEKNFSDVAEAQEKLQGKLSDYGSMTRKVVFHGMGEDGEDLVFTELSDMGEQIRELETYAQSAEQLKERLRAAGFTETEQREFFSEVMQMSLKKGMEFTELLQSASEEEFSDYVQQWLKKQQLAEQASKVLYREEFFHAADETKQYMEERLREAGLEIPEGFFVSGSLSAENFGSAFLEEMQNQMKKIRDMMDSFAVSLEPITVGGGATLQDARVYHNSTTYVLNGSGETVTQQLMSARNHSELERMRNG